MERKKYVAFFDVDKTIISLNSGKEIILTAYRNKLIKKAGLLKAIVQVVWYRHIQNNTLKLIHNMGSWMNGISRNIFEYKVIAQLEEKLVDSIRPQIIHEINEHRGQNAEIVILSSAPSEICNIVAASLEINNILCTRFESINGNYTGKTEGTFCFGIEKLVRLKEFCAQNDYPINEVYYYGDSIDDLPVLEKVGYPVCVSPDKKLRKIAIKKGWKIEYWS